MVSPGALQMLEIALERQIAAIANALPEPIATLDDSIDLTMRDTVIAQMDSLLRDDNPKAEQLLQEHKALFGAVLPRHFRQLSAAIEQYDFEKALLVLTEATNAAT
jgi:hypothetical protein